MATPVILAAVRTPICGLNGGLSGVPAPELGAACVRESLARSGMPPSLVDEVIMGNVLGAGLGQNPARQAMLLADVPCSTGAITVNKVCGSGLAAVVMASRAVRTGDAAWVVAGGMESMSGAPYLLPRARQGYRIGHGELIDAMLRDGLEDPMEGRPMGVYGDLAAKHHRISRAMQDDYAVRSYRRALDAQAHGWFEPETVPFRVAMKKGEHVVRDDEEPSRFDEPKLRGLRPAFDPEGSITAGNASTISDGAAALVIADRALAASHGFVPLAAIAGAWTFSGEPHRFPETPVGAVRGILDRLEWNVDEVDLFEVNEAFAVVALIAQRELGISEEKLNVLGGAVALGHPIGCSGARILVTLVHALRRVGGRRGIACLCIGGGEAIALAVERDDAA
ncbi:MAG: thiolase family protein [Planctomycetes bacterium]|nr:thiolase family protein [Planctomycetota bacterium]